ncbi:PucR family transcriptional regulator [Rhodococcus sp. NPDC003318]|uniref:PucR family transcriptional regulator n=1 Tax=Rhodococcus sp. NPDC003318 TaxID=3364503 RepID=UPI00367C9B48
MSERYSELETAERLNTLLHDVVRSDDQLAALASSASAYIVECVPELDTMDLRRALDACTRALAQAMLPGLVTGLTPQTLPDPVYDFVELLVARNMGLPVLLRICRAGQHATVHGLVDALALRLTDVPQHLLLHVASFTADWAGSTAETLSAAFGRTDGVGDPGQSLTRERAVRSVLCGSETDIGRAEQRMGYRLNEFHRGFVVWRDPGHTTAPGGADPDILSLAKRFAGADNIARSLIVADSGDTVWGWVRSTGIPDENTTGSGLSRSELARSGVVVAVGTPMPGIAGFRHTHQQAIAAQSVARLSTIRGAVVEFRDVEIEYLCSRDAPAMNDFVGRELGRLVAEPKLLDTLHGYLATGCSVEGASRRLRVHRNTIRYRLEQIESALGHPIETRRVELEVALRCARVFSVSRPERVGQ